MIKRMKLQVHLLEVLWVIYIKEVCDSRTMQSRKMEQYANKMFVCANFFS